MESRPLQVGASCRSRCSELNIPRKQQSSLPFAVKTTTSTLASPGDPRSGVSNAAAAAPSVRRTLEVTGLDRVLSILDGPQVGG